MEKPKTLIGRNTFIFHNVFNTDIFCYAHVTVHETTYDNKEWYYYSIDFEYPKENSIKANPFKNYKIFYDNGGNKMDVVVKN